MDLFGGPPINTFRESIVSDSDVNEHGLYLMNDRGSYSWSIFGGDDAARSRLNRTVDVIHARKSSKDAQNRPPRDGQNRESEFFEKSREQQK